MKPLEPKYYHYELDNYEGSDPKQRLRFIFKFSTDVPGELKTKNDGTTNEEILLMLIHRLKGLNEKLPSRESSLAITKCEEALMWLWKRTADRRERSVEGTSLA